MIIFQSSPPTNDNFSIQSTNILKLHVDIFDRWGIKIFEFNTIDGNWDGGSATEGTYYYILSAKTQAYKDIKKEGYFMLVK
jgi:large repetitive protein